MQTVGIIMSLEQSAAAAAPEAAVLSAAAARVSAVVADTVNWHGLSFFKIHHTPGSTTMTTPSGGVITPRVKFLTVTATSPPVEPTTTTTYITANEKRAEQTGEAPLPTTEVPVVEGLGSWLASLPRLLALEEPEPTTLMQVVKRKNTFILPHASDLPSPGDVYLCREPNFTGPCGWIKQTLGPHKCTNVPAEWVLHAASIQPWYNNTCYFWDAWDCGKNVLVSHTVFYNASVADVASGELGMNLLSWICSPFGE
jgi:hypothetical protein